jgi:hypothetical protein
MCGGYQDAFRIGFSILMDFSNAAIEQALEVSHSTDFPEFHRGKELCLDISLEEVIPTKFLP